MPSAPLPSLLAASLKCRTVESSRWTISSDTAWLRVTPASGTGQALLTVSVDAAAVGALLRVGFLPITPADPSQTPRMPRTDLRELSANRATRWGL